MTLEYKQALTEVNIIINYMNPIYLNKLPKKFVNFVNVNMDSEYIPNIDKNIPIDEQELKKDTKILLSLLYREYWCDLEKKKRLIEEDTLERQKEEKELKEKYSYENLFNSTNKNTQKEDSVEQIEERNMSELIEYKEVRWYKRIFEKIVGFFKKI